jgi:hypothetical protein
MKKSLLPLIIFLAAWIGLAAGIHTVMQNNTVGSDFYLFYHAGQNAFFDRTNPYSDEQARLNQLAIFKKLSTPAEDQLGFAYPPYSLLPVWPLLGLSFDWAQAIWTGFLLLSLVSIVPLAFPGAPAWIGVSVLFIYPFTFGLILGNFAILIAAILLVVYSRVIGQGTPGRGLQAMLGLLLAWATVKPQFVWLFVLFFLLAALRRRWWTFLGAFAAGLAAFVVVSFAIVPDWPALWIDRISKYAVYNQAMPVISVILKDILPLEVVTPLTLVLAAVLLAGSVWLFFRWWKGQLEPTLLLAWCGSVVYVLHPHGASYEQIDYLLPLVVWACQLQKTRSPARLAFWLGSLGLSWVAFFISSQAGAPSGSSEWPLIFNAAWVTWLFYKFRESNPRLATSRESLNSGRGGRAG